MPVYASLKRFFRILLFVPAGILADGLVVQEIVHNVTYRVLQALLELLEILLVKENLVFVICK